MTTNGTARVAASTAALLLCLITLLPKPAAAWGKEGHQIVAGIAEHLLQNHSPQTLAKAKQLLGGQSLMDIASYADDIRNQRPETKNWHFVDIPLEDSSYDPARDCKATPNGDCSIQALARFVAILGDKSQKATARAEVLKFVVHIVGDMHQPLHNVNDNDAGGNGKTVKFYDLQGFGGRPPNLHEVWDQGIIDHSRKHVADLINTLSSNESIDADMNSKDWVLEAHVLAQAAYKALPQPDNQEVYVLDATDAYYNKGLPVVNEQLRKGGIRLGKLLQETLK